MWRTSTIALWLLYWYFNCTSVPLHNSPDTGSLWCNINDTHPFCRCTLSDILFPVECFVIYEVTCRWWQPNVHHTSLVPQFTSQGSYCNRIIECIYNIITNNRTCFCSTADVSTPKSSSIEERCVESNISTTHLCYD